MRERESQVARGVIASFEMRLYLEHINRHKHNVINVRGLFVFTVVEKHMTKGRDKKTTAGRRR